MFKAIGKWVSDHPVCALVTGAAAVVGAALVIDHVLQDAPSEEALLDLAKTAAE